MGVMQGNAHACKRFILLMDYLESYLAELLGLVDYVCFLFLPSVVAASVMFVGRLSIDPNVNTWDQHETSKSNSKGMHIF
ncbi:unnamed protein product [Urochloa humidicola]